MESNGIGFCIEGLFPEKQIFTEKGWNVFIIDPNRPPLDVSTTVW